MPELSQPWDFAGFSTRNGSEKLYDIELVKQDLLNHFYTRRGELDWNPEYGSIIMELLFENRTDARRREIENDVKRIIRSDPRIELKKITVTTQEHGYYVDVQITYLGQNPSISLQIDFDERNFNEEAV